MATHKSAEKALRQNLRHRERNRHMRTRLRTALKSIRAAISAGDAAKAGSALRSTISLIDRMVTKGVIHRNAAGRYKSRLVKRLARASA